MEKTMSERHFQKMLDAQWAKNNLVCVGLDSDYSQLPSSVRQSDVRVSMVTFNRAIVDATQDMACAYKPNIAFYEAHGESGWMALRETIQYIHQVAPAVPVILDAKRADIGSTNLGYVKAYFDELKADAVTVHPYLGAEALQPFLQRENKGIIVLCRTSNPGAGEFQDLRVNDEPLYRVVARQVATKWNDKKNCSLVVGATYPEELSEVRQLVGDMPILIPGIGAQGGDVEKVVRAGRDSRGGGMMINSSRGIIFASKEADFAEAARREAKKLHEEINTYR
jgi:orotidine-5'-phosphate decarboxylase